ncbi:MAG: CoA pyrophosphatase [Cyclobacteriaceae bacterium]
MKFYELVNYLDSALKAPLPGKKGQVLMAPKPIEDARFEPERMKRARKGAVLLLIYPGKATVLVPFIKRPIYLGVHSGQVALPGGKMDPGDPDLEYTALRETEEEIGVDKTSVKLLGQLSALYVSPSNFSIVPFVGFTENPPEFKPDPREVDKLITCDFSQLIYAGVKKEKTMEPYQGVNIVAPYYEIGGEMVWGATAMILSEFLLILKSSNL